MSADQEQLEALDVARDLARHGVPIFLAEPAMVSGKWDPTGGHNGCGYWLPDGWHLTTPDPAVVDAWKPGMALCAVGGHAVDFLDVDPRNGGDQSAEQLRAAALWPVAIGEAATPSGGTHHVVNVLRVRSRDNVLPGLDVKAGHAEGRVKGDGSPDDGRGFVFLAPTRKRSKSSGRVGRYVWTTPPSLEELDPADPSVEPLRDLVEQARGRSGTSTPADTPHAAWDALDASQRARVERWLRSAVEGERLHLADVATWPEGRTDERGRGWEKLVSDVAHRFGALARADWTPWTLEDGRRAFHNVVPAAVLVAVPGKWEDQHHRGAPAAWPAALDTPTSSTSSTTSAAAEQQDDEPPPVEDGQQDDDECDTPRRSIASRLVDLALERYRFTATPDGEPFAVPLPGAPTGSGHVVRMLRGGRQSLRAELASLWRAKTRGVAPQQALADALRTLEGDAQAAEPEALHVRVAEHGGAVFLDLGDSLERVVRLAGGRWEVVESGVPVLFRRTALTGALPVPVPGGGIERLWELLNVSPEDRGLVLAWLVAAIVAPDVPHAILLLTGEQGSGKSSAFRLLVALVDPSPVPLRKPPRDQDSWVTAAQGSWVVALDNLSTIPDWLSESLCRASTGEGDVRRQLYSDAELAVFAFRRCVALNGIELGAVRGDLAERLVAVELERIPEDRRRTEHQLDQEWREAYPAILGGLLDLAAGVAHVLPSVHLASMPRMADFAVVAAAVDRLLGTRALDRFMEQSKTMAEDSLTADSFLAAMVSALTVTFEGTAAELLAHVTPTTDGWRRPTDWPKNPQQVSGRLRRNAPALRKSGWLVEDDGARNRDGVKVWRVTPPATREGVGESSPPSPHPRPRRSGTQDAAGMTSTASPHIPAASPPVSDASPLHPRVSPRIPATGEPATCEDGGTGIAGMESLPPLSPEYPPCVDCGAPVRPLVSGTRCLRCKLRAEGAA